ncbi:phosphoribosylanthranilate isomerase [Clostridium oceanicum]|uniref:N-(5'-phosphoribosyl)anthranilate isomerase n=1 Tax=Clostridium oceanicum TaxID=1543 RepID=A0ABP3UQ64_9CLOT
MNTKVKICGLKSLKDISIVNKYDIDYVGFVFAKSKRQVTKELAKKMKERLKGKIKAVGVFVDTPYERINEIIEYASLDMVQLHGNETNDLCSKINKPVLKAISIKNKDSVNKVLKYKDICGFVVDGAVAGSGKVFDWNFIGDISSNYFTFLAGGLNEENVEEAIEKIKPQVVDVSSGVEVDGIKNEEKIKKFIRKVKNNG